MAQTPIEEMNIYQKIARVREGMEVVRKNKAGYGYKYVSEDELLARITVAMKKYGLLLIPGIIEDSCVVEPYRAEKRKKEKDGTVYIENVSESIVHADMTWTWVNINNPEERLVIPWMFVGQQSDASQAFGAGLTYASRYFLLKFFNVATPDDDPDLFRSKQREAAAAADHAVAAEIISGVDAYIKAYLLGHPDQRDAMIKFITKYVKSGDYFKIKESSLATKLLQDVRATFPDA